MNDLSYTDYQASLFSIAEYLYEQDLLAELPPFSQIPLASEFLEDAA